jgi:ABC-type xylose transport system substrate-binding protein
VVIDWLSLSTLGFIWAAFWNFRKRRQNMDKLLAVFEKQLEAYLAAHPEVIQKLVDRLVTRILDRLFDGSSEVK